MDTTPFIEGSSVVDLIKAGYKRRIIDEQTKSHLDPSFILCYGSEYKRFWSQENCAVGPTKREMTSLMLETLLYLKSNRSFWGLNWNM